MTSHPWLFPALLVISPSSTLRLYLQWLRGTEFGHALHDLLARTTFSRLQGYQTTVRELAEGIGMTFEHWCWLKDEVISLSCHYTQVDQAYAAAWKEEHPDCQDLPPEKIPEEMLEKRLRRRGWAKLLHLMVDL